MAFKQAVRSWLMLLAACPKGIVTFVIAVAGVSIGIALLIVWVGIPILVGTLLICRALMERERQLGSSWLGGQSNFSEVLRSGLKPAGYATGYPRGGVRELIALLGERRTYTGLVYCLAQLPIGIISFTIAATVPIAALGLALAPFSYLMNAWLPFELNSLDAIAIPMLSPFQVMLAASAVGLVTLALQPLMFRSLGRVYAGWLSWLSSSSGVPPLQGSSAKPVI
ncbi:sensor domain-containing protein [Paenibacillus daejeonensis]|uniref:sensor domain-containing protein n=1 Tax=Paenibacillus daejeonensis TaxID=135193 RepID=UPI00035FC6DD|nr:sensor domain-containing protein [Paenibacillus daejeonensis]